MRQNTLFIMHIYLLAIILVNRPLLSLDTQRKAHTWYTVDSNLSLSYPFDTSYPSDIVLILVSEDESIFLIPNYEPLLRIDYLSISSDQAMNMVATFAVSHGSVYIVFRCFGLAAI